MSTFVVVTSIFEPTEAVRAFAAIDGFQVVVAGDLKTPRGWSCNGVRFLSLDEQESRGYAIAESLPKNHYCRKMTGYLDAIARGADVIIDTDDDNVPKSDYAFPPFDGRFPVIAQREGFVNVYSAFTEQYIWPRGFPLELIRDPRVRVDRAATAAADVRIGVWQGLADDDPDVDAIYRLAVGTPCVFDDGAPLVLAAGVWCPYNSQNSAYRRELFPLLYLPAFVTFRFTDVLRGLVAQPILHAAGYRLGFTAATVVQARNPHDYLRDFELEIPCYLQAQRVIEVTRAVVREGAPVRENLREAYHALARATIVPARELALLEAWLLDLDRAANEVSA